MQKFIWVGATGFLFFLTETANAQNAGAGKAFNPDVSVNILSSFQHSNRGANASGSEGLNLDEVEMQFASDVDPYLRAMAMFSVSKADQTQVSSGSSSPSASEYTIEPEEVYAETISLPLVTLRAGRFRVALGKHNTLHTHAFPFIDAPLINQKILGSDGVSDVGVSAATLIPLPWYMEVTLQAIQGNTESLAKSPNNDNVVPVVHLKNLWDFSDSLTCEIGLTGSRYANAFNDQSTIKGADLTFKWRPVEGGKYNAIIWGTEYLERDQKNSDEEQVGGFASWLQWQFAEQWWIQGRDEYVGMPKSDSTVTERKLSALLAYNPSEFSGFRLQYDLLNDNNDKPEQRIMLQMNITIGAHPAHAY